MKVSAERPTRAIIEAGEIIQGLKPERLATLSFVEDDTIETQREMASALDCSAPTVSNHLTSFASLPIPIVDRDGPFITSTGEDILGSVNDLTQALGTDLDDVVWSDTDAQAAVDRCLAPLHSSRGSLLFLVLHSIGVRNSAGETIDLLQSPEPIRISPIVADVTERQQERGETVSREQVRWRLTKLADTASIELDEKTVELTQKGEAQARFFERIIQFVEQEDSDGSSLSVQPGNTRSEQHGIGPDDDAVPVNFEVDSEALAFVPEYYCDDEAVITLRESMTVDEFVDTAARLRDELDGDVALELNWMLRQPDKPRSPTCETDQ